MRILLIVVLVASVAIGGGVIWHRLDTQQRDLANEQALIYQLRSEQRNAAAQVGEIQLREATARRKGQRFDHQLVEAAVQRASTAEFNLEMEESLHPDAVATMK